CAASLALSHRLFKPAPAQRSVVGELADAPPIRVLDASGIAPATPPRRQPVGLFVGEGLPRPAGQTAADTIVDIVQTHIERREAGVLADRDLVGGPGPAAGEALGFGAERRERA